MSTACIDPCCHTAPACNFLRGIFDFLPRWGMVGDFPIRLCMFLCLVLNQWSTGSCGMHGLRGSIHSCMGGCYISNISFDGPWLSCFVWSCWCSCIQSLLSIILLVWCWCIVTWVACSWYFHGVNVVAWKLCAFTPHRHGLLFVVGNIIMVCSLSICWCVINSIWIIN